LDHIWPNRDHGFTSPRIVPNALDIGYVNDVPRERLQWKIDHESKTATTDAPMTLSVPLQPMLGCFGVAPSRRQAISTATSGPHGGNMDYNGFVAGVMAYFPVFVEGALLFHVGDGHAWQADGEILGTGIEISMDVTVTVRVIKGKQIGWPRGENEDYIFTLGNARPLDQAVQHATTEMLRWLQADYALDAKQANILLGSHVEYDLGNMCDPAYTMVCKLPKRVLPARITGV
jgi:acetamidase/formamidase